MMNENVMEMDDTAFIMLLDFIYKIQQNPLCYYVFLVFLQITKLIIKGHALNQTSQLVNFCPQILRSLE
jgi:hypothetical protein